MSHILWLGETAHDLPQHAVSRASSSSGPSLGCKEHGRDEPGHCQVIRCRTEDRVLEAVQVHWQVSGAR